MNEWLEANGFKRRLGGWELTVTGTHPSGIGAIYNVFISIEDDEGMPHKPILSVGHMLDEPYHGNGPNYAYLPFVCDVTTASVQRLLSLLR